MKFRSYHKKFATIAFSATLLTLSSIQAVYVSRSNITSRVKEIARRHLSNNGYSSYNIPNKLQIEYDQKITDITQRLINRTDRQGRSYVDEDEVWTEVRSTMSSFIRNLASCVSSFDIDSKVREAIRQHGFAQGVNPDNIPSNMYSEFCNRRNKVKDELRRTMSRDSRNYVRENEIKKEVENNFGVFFARMKREQNNSWSSSSSYSNSNTSSGSSWWDTFFGTGNSSSSSSYNSSSSYDSNKVYSSSLDNKVLDEANQILREHGINPSTIPARVVSDFNDAISRITRQMRNIMSTYNRTYVRKDEIRTAAMTEINTVINKIKFIGEICVICQDNYKSGERIGILSCGHTYHKDCIYTWLEHQKTCPLCRASGVIVSKQVSIP